MNRKIIIYSTIVRLVIALAMIIIPGWILFIKFDFIHVPGLIKFFPAAYSFLIAFFIVGIYVFVKECIRIYRLKKK